MTTVIYFSITVLIAAAVFFGIRFFVRARRLYGGAQRITCPETGKTAMVELSAVRAALTSAVGKPDIRLESCYIVQSFRRDHLDLVVYRPWRIDIPRGADCLSASRHP